MIDRLYDSLLEKCTVAMTTIEPGDPTPADTKIGPLSSSTAAERLEREAKAAIEPGATVAGRRRELDGSF